MIFFFFPSFTVPLLNIGGCGGESEEKLLLTRVAGETSNIAITSSTSPADGIIFAVDDNYNKWNNIVIASEGSRGREKTSRIQGFVLPDNVRETTHTHT